MKSYIFAAFLMPFLVVQTAMAKPSESASIDREKLVNFIESHQLIQAKQIEELAEQVEQLKVELEQAKGEGAQFWYKRIAQVCGGVTATGLVLVFAKLNIPGIKILEGKYARNKYGSVAAIAGGVCGVIALTLHELTDGKVEQISALLDAAEIEYELAKEVEVAR